MADAASGGAAPLDEVMLAMDVVDTLRHNQRLVERELGTERREETLVKRLREIYAAQGIEVTDAILEEGVKALKEERFSYKPPAASLQTKLAHLYVGRNRWLKPAMGAIVLVIVLALGWQFATGYWERQQTAMLAEAPKALSEEIELIAGLAKDEAALTVIDALRDRGEAAVARGETAEIAAVQAELGTLRSRLEQEYVIRVVSRQGESSGVYRTPADNPSARNYYLIAEAIDDNGHVVPVSVTSEEDGQTRSVEQWGVRVRERDYQRVAEDKRDDGIIQSRELGAKERGYLEPRYTIPVPGGAITAW